MRMIQPVSRNRPHGLLLRGVLVVLLLVGVTTASCERGRDETSAEDPIHRPSPAEVRTPSEGEAATPAEVISGIAPHEHDPEHGGTVRSVDVYHVEVVRTPVQVWLYDRRGKPLEVADVAGQIVIYSDDQRRPVDLRPAGEYLSPAEEITFPQEGIAFVELTIGKQSIDVAFELPLGS